MQECDQKARNGDRRIGLRWHMLLPLIACTCVASDRPVDSAAVAHSQTLGASDSSWALIESSRGFKQCVVEEVGRSHFRTGPDQYLYVEAQALLSTERGLFVAGQPVYEWRVDEAGGGTLLSEGKFFGLVADGEHVSVIAFPPGVDRVGAVRGGRLGRERFGFLFDDGDAYDPGSSTPRLLKYAEYGSTGWTQVEVVSLPPGGRVSGAQAASALVLGHDGTVSFLIPFAKDQGRIDVLVAERSEAGWRTSVVFKDWVDNAALGIEASGSRIALLAGLDPEFDAQLASVREISLDGFGTKAPPRSVRRTLGAPGERFRSGSFAGAGVTLQAGWIRASDSATSVWLQAIPGSAPVQVATDGHQLVGVFRSAELPVWLTHVINPWGGAGRIEVASLENERAVDMGGIGYPFVGPFNAVQGHNRDLFLIGPEARLESMHPFVRSLVIRLSFDCT